MPRSDVAAVAVVVVLGLAQAAQASTTNIHVRMNTAPLVGHPAGPFTMLFAMTDGSGVGDANNTVAVLDIDLHGGAGSGGPVVFGGGSGDLESGIVFTDAAFLSFVSEGFTPGAVLSFTLTVTTSEDEGEFPDRLTFAVLDRSGRPIPTLAPAGDLLFGFDLPSSANVETFATDQSRTPIEGGPIALGAPLLDSTPPLIVPHITGANGNNGWYVSNVTVTWDVSDPESSIASSTGCTPTALTADSTALTLTCSATNEVGLTAPVSIELKIDKASPTVACGTADAIWYAADVPIHCNASDATSGLVDPDDTSFALVTFVPLGMETANASTTSRSVCDVAGHCATAGPIGGNRIDKKPPTATIAAPVMISYLLHQAVTALYTCTDDGSGVALCQGPVVSGTTVPTAALGSVTFTVTAEDAVGNRSTLSIPYAVTYGVLPLYNQTHAVKNGSTVPIKIQLTDAAGANVSSEAIVVNATAITMVSTSTSGTLADAGNANPDDNFRFDPSLGATGGYIFNVKTTELATGVYAIAFTATGDAVHHEVQFQVK